jgi:hypothetical protein
LPKQKTTNAYDGVKNKESIVTLKPRVVVFFVMIGMQNP